MDSKITLVTRNVCCIYLQVIYTILGRCTPLYILPGRNLYSSRIKHHGSNCGPDPIGVIDIFNYFYVGGLSSVRKGATNLMFLFWLLISQGQIYWAGTTCPRVRFRREHSWVCSNSILSSFHLKHCNIPTFIVSYLSRCYSELIQWLNS